MHKIKCAPKHTHIHSGYTVCHRLAGGDYVCLYVRVWVWQMLKWSNRLKRREKGKKLSVRERHLSSGRSVSVSHRTSVVNRWTNSLRRSLPMRNIPDLHTEHLELQRGANVSKLDMGSKPSQLLINVLLKAHFGALVHWCLRLYGWRWITQAWWVTTGQMKGQTDLHNTHTHIHTHAQTV